MGTRTWTDRVAVLAGGLALAAILVGSTGVLAAYGQWVGRPCPQCRDECMYFVQQCMRLPPAQRPPGCGAIGGNPTTYCDGWCAGCVFGTPEAIADCAADQCRMPEGVVGDRGYMCSNACNNYACGSYSAGTRCLTQQDLTVEPTNSLSQLYCDCVTPP